MVLGFINATSLAGGKLHIDRALSENAIRVHVGDPLGLPMQDAAHGIRAVANAAMARAIRAVTVERGLDPRDLDADGVRRQRRRARAGIWRGSSVFRAW